jgi:hypothetical protein
MVKPPAGLPRGDRCPQFDLCYNRAFTPPKWRYRLGVRTEDSQSSNPGSIPGSATSLLLLSTAISYTCRWRSEVLETRRISWCGTVAASRGHNLRHRAVRDIRASHILGELPR